MPWVKLDDTFPEHPKILAVGGNAGWLHVCALAYCNRNLTDGYIPAFILGRLSDRKQPTILASRLVAAGLWETADDGWRIHDFLEYQTSKAKVEDERAKARDRMAKARGSSQDVRPNNQRSSPNPTTPHPTQPLVVEYSNNSHPPCLSNTAEDPIDIRRKKVIDHYARIAVDKANVTTSANGYRRKAIQTAQEHPDLDRYLTRWPTAPPDAIAAWLHGDKHSMAYFPDANDDTP